jgi:hypothetical protein
MPDELPKDKGPDFTGGLPQFPKEARDLPERTDPKTGGTRRRWLYVGAVLGAAFGLTYGIPEVPGWIRFPGYLVGLLVGLIPGLPNWVFTWVCPTIGWGVVGGLAGWVLDDFLEQREHRDRLFRE